MSKFTPGPWHVDGHNLTAVIASQTKPGITQDWTTYKHVCTCDYGYDNPGENLELNKANAKLIAAAPEMYELLHKIVGSMTLERVERFDLNEQAKTLLNTLLTPETWPV